MLHLRDFIAVPKATETLQPFEVRGFKSGDNTVEGNRLFEIVTQADRVNLAYTITGVKKLIWRVIKLFDGGI